MEVGLCLKFVVFLEFDGGVGSRGGSGFFVGKSLKGFWAVGLKCVLVASKLSSWSLAYSTTSAIEVGLKALTNGLRVGLRPPTKLSRIYDFQPAAVY